jgi:hypothetical protein
MFFLVISLVVACLVPAQVMAATFYVNGSCSTNGNGTGETCAVSSGGAGAWNSLEAASYCDGMNPGDVLEVRGGIYREGRLWQPESGCSGTPGNNVIIQNYAGEEVILDGTRDISGSTWTSRGNGVYECTSGSCGTTRKIPFTAWYDTGSGEQRLNLIQTNRTCDSSLAVGYMRYTTGGGVCAHLADNSNPANANYFRIPYISSAIQLGNNGTDYMTFRKNPAGGSFKIERWRDHGIVTSTTNLGIHYDGLEISWMMDRAINQSEGGQTAAAYRIVNNTIHHIGQEGIRFSQDTSSNGLIDNNTLYAIQTEPVFERCRGDCQSGFSDNGTAIRVVEAENVTITNNTISDIGGGGGCRSYGIDLEYGCVNCTIDANYIYDSNRSDCSSPSSPQAILLSSSTNVSYAGTVVSNNRVHDVNVCIAVDLTTAKAGTTQIVNNTCSEPGEYGFQKQDGSGGTWEITNNIFTADRKTPKQLMRNDSTSGYTPSYNAFYCTTCSGGNIVYWMGSNFKRDGDCSPGTDCIEDLDANSDYGDPNVDITGNPPSLRILSMSGTAYDRGIIVGPSVDFEDELRPMGATQDIGADEYGGGSASEPSPPNPPVDLRVLQQ